MFAQAYMGRNGWAQHYKRFLLFDPHTFEKTGIPKLNLS